MGTVLVSKVPEPYSRNKQRREIGDEFMPANITVIGVNDGMGGLKESLAKFRSHHHEVGDALMNISGVGTATGDKVDKDEPRPPYQHAEWPRMEYHADGREEIAVTPDDRDALLKRGFRDAPYLRPQVAVLNPAEEKKVLMDQNRQQQAQITQQGEIIEMLKSRLDAIEAKEPVESGKRR